MKGPPLFLVERIIISCYLDVRPWNLTGKEAEKLLEEAGITVNKNTIPYDPESPFVTSGIRMGTAALTTRGMKQEEMVKIGKSDCRCS